jgi:small nuclear ribonucleoprotein (snRNP)-like protein
MGIKVKRTLGTRITNISNELNIPKVTVESVIRAYLEGLIESAEQGENIVIDNIMSIKVINEPNGSTTVRGRVSPALKSRLCGNDMIDEDMED